MDYISRYNSSIGPITMASDGVLLVGLWFDGQRYFADTLDDIFEERDDLNVFETTRRWLDIYFGGKNPDFMPPICMRATDFRKTVWKVLMTIPFGQTMTYGEVARIVAGKMGLPSMSAQAVGGAIGHNSISIVIPCHRVIAADGTLTGYAAGIDKKSYLLNLEKGTACM